MANGGAIILGMAALLGAVGLSLAMGQGKGQRPPCSDVHGGVGDIDGDGRVTEKDARLLALYLEGRVELSPQQLRRAEVAKPSRTGEVTTLDVLWISNYARGNVTSLPICDTILGPGFPVEALHDSRY